MRRRDLVLCVGLGLAACVGYWLVLRSYAVPWALSKQMRRGATVDFAQVAPFAWDRVHVFSPYTSHDHIHAGLGFHWEGVKSTSIAWSDSVNLVVFVRDNDVVYWFEHTRHEDLAQLARPRGYARQEAQFRVIRVGVEQRLALAPPRR